MEKFRIWFFGAVSLSLLFLFGIQLAGIELTIIFALISLIVWWRWILPRIQKRARAK